MGSFPRGWLLQLLIRPTFVGLHHYMGLNSIQQTQYNIEYNDGERDIDIGQTLFHYASRWLLNRPIRPLVTIACLIAVARATLSRPSDGTSDLPDTQLPSTTINYTSYQ